MPGPGEIVVVRVSLALPEAQARALASLLTPEEVARVDRSPIEAVRRRNTLTRGWARHLLGQACGTDPRALRFGVEPGGKPTLEGAGAGPGEGEARDAAGGRPVFNLSHTGDHLLLALAREGYLGVDAELHRPLPELDGVARRVFTPEEREALARAHSEKERLHAFYRGWTRKEALLKALGGGLAIPLRRFSVSLEPGKEGGERGGEEGESPVRVGGEGAPLLRRFPDPASLDLRRLSPGAERVPPDAWWVGDLAEAAPDPGEGALAWDRIPARIRCVVAPGV